MKVFNLSRSVRFIKFAVLLIFAGSALSGCKTRFRVENNLRGAAASPRPDTETMTAFARYCSGCHAAYGPRDGQVDGDAAWKNIHLDAKEIASRLDWDTAAQDHMMPPPGSNEQVDLSNAPNDRQKMLAAVTAVSRGDLAPDLPLDQIKLQPGFKISVWAKVPGARSMTLGDDGTVYVGSGGLGGRHKKVYAVQDLDGNGSGESVTVIRDFEVSDPQDSLAVPNGVAFRDGKLYVGLIDRIVRFDGIASNFSQNPKPAVEMVRFPEEMRHGWKFIGFGPDGRLYVPVGADGNMTTDPDQFGLIYRLSSDMTRKEIFAKGVRNSVGFDWHPQTGELWFTDNGRDNLVINTQGSDDIPPDELNRAPQSGLNFGHPFCHAGTIADPDPEYARLGACADAVPPVQNLLPHAAALGMRFYTGKSYPQEFRNQILIAEHGSWNRSTRIGYRVSLVRLEGNRSTSYEDFASGWLTPEGDRWGRPVDVQVAPDGAVLVSDDMAGVIYRIAYQP